MSVVSGSAKLSSIASHSGLRSDVRTFVRSTATRAGRRATTGAPSSGARLWTPLSRRRFLRSRGGRARPSRDEGRTIEPRGRRTVAAALRARHRETSEVVLGAGRSILGIESDGAIKACPSLPSREYIGGSVRDHSLVDIWERAKEMRFMRDAEKTQLWGGCADCYYADDCQGGCSWTAHSLFGRRGNNPLCHHRALELLKRGRRERLLRVEEAPGESFDHGVFEIVEEDWPAAELERARAVADGNEAWLLA